MPVKRSMTRAFDAIRSTSSSKRSADLGQIGLVGQAADPGASGDDAAPQQSVTGDRAVEPQELLSKGERPGLGEPEPDVVAEGADVGDVVVETFELQAAHCAGAGRPPAPGSARASSTARQ